MAFQALILGHSLLCSKTQQKLQVPDSVAAVTVPASRGEPNYELLILDVRYGSLRLTNALSVLQGDNGLRYLPLRNLSKHLNFHLFVVPVSGQATGFLTLPTDRIELKSKSGTCKRKNETTVFDPALCFEKDGDLYVESELFALLTGLKFTWRLTRLELEVQSNEPLSVRPDQFVAPKKNADLSKQDLETISAPYKALSFPTLDLQIFSASDSTGQQNASSSAFSLSGVGDLGYMNAKYHFGANNEGRFNSTLSLGREDFKGNLLGPLRATKFEFGDLTFPPVPLLSRGRSGLGFSISNSPLSGYGSETNEAIEGHAKSGSTLELFRNNVRISTVVADSNGRFIFSNIQLETGPNTFQIVEVTPEGEVLTEERVLYGDASGPKSGQSRYQITASQVGGSLFGNERNGLASDRTELIGQYQLGLSSGSWLSATMGQLNGDGSNANFLGVGYHSWGGGAQWHLNAMANDEGGSAFSGGIWQKIGSNTLWIEHTQLSSGFQGNALPEIESNATSVTKLRFDGIGKIGQSHLSYGLSADRYDGTNPATLIRARFSGGSGTTYFSNSFTTRLSKDPFSGSGLLQFRKRLDRSSLRFDLGYGLGVGSGVQTARVALDKWLNADYRYRYGLEYDASRLDSFAGIGTIYRALGPIFIGLNFSANLRGGINTNLMLSAGLSGEPSADSLQLVRPGSGALGTVSLRVYLDRNLSGTFDDGDLPLPGIGVRVGRSALAAKTNASGYCTLERLMTNQEIIIALNEVTFEDPSWISDKPGVLAILRPGSSLKTEFAVTESAEIEGKISGASRNTGFVVELLDSSGELKQSSYVDDQFEYVFSRVRPSDYTLRLKDPSGRVIGEHLVKARRDSYLRGHDFVVPAGN